MAGRGRLDEVPILQDQQVFMFRNGCWSVAEEPLHVDKPEFVGIGLGMSFAVELLAHNYPSPIGLVPCAVGGTPLDRWMPEVDLYKNAVSTTRRALSEGTLRGILWHQGESDSGNPEEAENYGKRFQKMVTCMRMDLSSGDVPVLTGELGSFLHNKEGYESFKVINQQFIELKKILPSYACVSSSGLSDNGDKLHFNSESLRVFGLRYAIKYMEMEESEILSRL